MSWYVSEDDQGIVLDDEAISMFHRWLEDPEQHLIAHNGAFDLLVMMAEDESLIPLVFRAARAGRLHCTKIRQKILDNASGELKYLWDEELEQWKGQSFKLDRLVWRFFKVFLSKKEDTWRLRYSQLYGIPVDEWPQEARDYSLSDSVWTHKLFMAQEEILAGDDIPGEAHVTRTAIALAMLRSWGVRTDPDEVDDLRDKLTAEYELWVARAQELGLVRYPKAKKKPSRAKKKPKDPRSKNMKLIKARVEELYTSFGLTVPLSDSGKNTSTNRETLTFGSAEGKKLPRITAWEDESKKGDPSWNVACVDMALKAVAEVTRIGKLLTTYVPILERGVEFPITPDYNEFVESGRTSCAKPNLQNQGRGGGVRKCYWPRLGWIFAFCDFDTLEFRTLGQTCLDLFGYSTIVDVLREGKDLHIDLAADSLELTYEETLDRYNSGDKIIADVRQGMKIVGYGAAGGMGADALVEYARGFGMDISRERAVDLLQAFKSRRREMVDYFNHCSNQIGDNGTAKYVVHPRTGMVRGDVRYTALCNHGFQHLAAVGATDALFCVVEECFVPGALELETQEDGSVVVLPLYGSTKGRTSDLYGCRPWLFNHDEVGMEIPREAIGAERSHRAAMRLQTVMIARMSFWCPDVPIGATVALARRWHKGAKSMLVNGLLVPVKPIKDDKGKEIWVHDEDDSQGAYVERQEERFAA